MITALLFLFVICSGSVFSLSWFNKKFEDTLSITIMGSILILYFMGIVNLLGLGIYLIVALAGILYMLSLLRIIKYKEYKAFSKGLFSTGFVIFMIVFVCSFLLNYGKLTHNWDEFSHWSDVVKAMFAVDDFATNPSSNSTFQSYPPGMALFQYLMQKLNQVIYPKTEFVEWFTYYCYQVFFVSILLPLFRDVKLKERMKIFFLCIIAFWIPIVYFNQLYVHTYVEPLLGILLGTGIAAIFIRKQKDWAYHTYMWLICCMLVLMKDIGIVLSIFVMLGYFIDIIFGILENNNKKNIVSGSMKILFLTISVFFIKFLWKIEVVSSGANVVFNQNVDFVSLINVLLGREHSYREMVIHNYRKAMCEQGLLLGILKIEINYFLMLVVFTVLSHIIWKALVKRSEATNTIKALLVLQIVQCVGYIIGMCIMYMYKFSEYEALKVASNQRYINVIFLSWCIILLVMAEPIIVSYLKKMTIKRAAILFLAFAICTPIQPIIYTFTQDKQKSINIRERYSEISEKVASVCDGDDKIYFVSQEDNGFDYWVSKFTFRPNKVINSGYSWSIGVPFYENDIWTKSITVDEWKKDLERNYDYVVLYKINDYFVENFAAAFKNPELIAENHIYKVNKLSGILEKCL